MAAVNEARIWGVMAASGSGKGLWIKDFLRTENPVRGVIWDYKDEYDEYAPKLTSSLEVVRKAMIAAGNGPMKIRYKCKPGTSKKQRIREFEDLCCLVQMWGNCMFLAEELSNVTTPSWAPSAWSEMTSGGRHENIHVIGVAQNPAMIDKTFLSNCTLIHVGTLNEYRHRQAVARSMDIDVERINELVQFQWLERNNKTKEVTCGWSYPPGHAATATDRTCTPTRRGASKAGRTPKKPMKSRLRSDATNQQTEIPK